MTILSAAQIDRFWSDGILTVEDAVPPGLLSAMRRQFADWIEESRRHDTPYGETVDGRPRFDLEPGHGPDAPALRRVNAPADVSSAFFDAMSDSPMTDMVADLVGPNVKHHHNKINSKMPGAATEVKWHQDFPFTPHSNTDLVTALLLLDDVTEENGPPEVVPGSHKGPLHSLWHDGVFTGAVDRSTAASMQAAAVKCCAPAGSVCLMHTCVAHGSAPNRSDGPRTLFITVYSAADAVPCSPNPVPNMHEGLIVRGTEPNIIRATEYELRPPEFPEGASFFVQQTRNRREAAK